MKKCGQQPPEKSIKNMSLVFIWNRDILSQLAGSKLRLFWACDETEYGIRDEKTPDLTDSVKPKEKAIARDVVTFFHQEGFMPAA